VTKISNAVKNTTPKLAQATANVLYDPSQSSLVFTSSVDKMDLPKKYNKLIELCRFFYKRDPVAGTVLNKIVDCAITPLTNRKSTCSDTEYEVYNSLSEMLQEFYRCVCLEYLLSVLVIPHYEWSRVKGSDISSKLNSRARFTVPTNIWFRDPAVVRIKSSPIPNKKYFYVKVDMETINFIKTGGTLSDGTVDKTTYEELERNYPEFVKAVKAIKGTSLEIKLEGVRPIVAKTLPEDDYPIPYMSNALESLIHKRNLRKMDYSIAARVIAAIQLVQLGSDEFPCTDEADFERIKSQMNMQTTTGQAERIFQLFANHTLKITWVFPDTEAMLNEDKYREVNDDIISSFGFPRTLITGETLRSNVQGGSDFAAFSPLATMETIRDILLEWTKGLYKEVKEQNRFSNMPIPMFSPMRLYRLLDINVIGQSMYQEGNLSRRTRMEMVGTDFDTEVERMEQENKVYREKNLLGAPPLPYSSPNIGKPSGNNEEENDDNDKGKDNKEKE
jgi:hypothetical protein